MINSFKTFIKIHTFLDEALSGEITDMTFFGTSDWGNLKCTLPDGVRISVQVGLPDEIE